MLLTQEYDLSLCVSLLSMLDFRGDKRVHREDWRRGTRAMALHAMGEDDGLWAKLLDKFGARDSESIDLRTVEDLVPIDPRVGLLLKVALAARLFPCSATRLHARAALQGTPPIADEHSRCPHWVSPDPLRVCCCATLC